MGIDIINDKITVLLFAYNEEFRIRYFLESVKNNFQLVVIDNYSEDNTFNIAKEYTEAVFQYKNPGTGDDPKTMDFAMSCVNTEWVFGARTDEIIPLPLIHKLDEIVRADICDIVRISRFNLLFGHPSTSWGKDFQSALFKQQFLDYKKDALFELTFLDTARILALPPTRELSIWHFSNYDITSYVDADNRYSSMAARNVMIQRTLSKQNFTNSLETLKVIGKTVIGKFQLSRRFTFLRILLNPCLRFFWHYFIRGGIQSGWVGFTTSYLMMMEQMLTELKIWELENGISKAKIDDYYNSLKTILVAGEIPELEKKPFSEK